MPKAVYLGSANSYKVGPHTFTKDSAEQEVSDQVAAILSTNDEFSIDGKGGKPRADRDGELPDGPVIPAAGFKDREAALAFAKKFLPNLDLDPNRSTAELTRRIDAALSGGDASPSETVGDTLPGAGKGKKTNPKVTTDKGAGVPV